MGICSSCESTSVATAKLILQDGRLQEFSYPVKVSYVLQRDPTCFICNSDEMDFGDVISAVRDDEELQLGQLYFALPLNRLKHRLQAEEMAALAVKANSALAKSGGDRCRHHRKSYFFAGEKDVKMSGKVADSGSAGEGGLQKGRRGKFNSRLSAIPE